MRIGIILDSEIKNDIRVLNEAKYLSEIGHEVFVLCINFGKQESYENYKDLQIFRFKLKKTLKNKLYGLINILPLYEWIWSRKINWFIEQNDIEVLHVHDLYMSKSASVASKNRQLPIILDLHENYPDAVMSYNWATHPLMKYLARPWLWKKKEKEYLSYASRIIVLSDNFKRSLLTQYSFLHFDNIVIYPNVPDIEDLLKLPVDTKIFTKKDDEFILFYFGGISERRGIFTCFIALKMLLSENFNIRLLLIGPVDKADANEFYHFLNNPCIKDHVTYFPWKDISLLPSYINISNLCLSPIFKNRQHESGVANKIFQYMLFAKPLLVSDCEPQQKIVEEGKCGLVFESDNPNDLAEKIKELYGNQELCRQFGENGKKIVIEIYNLQNFGQNLKNLYNSIG